MIEELTFGGFYDQNHDADIVHIRNYGVTLNLQQRKQVDQIRYQMKTTCTKTSEHWMWEITLEKTALYINDSPPNSLKQKLDADFGTTVLYPISVWVTPTGIIKGMSERSFSAIADRFKTFKKRTLQENSGTNIEKYLHQLEKGIATQKKLLRYLMFDWFWALYFAPIYNNTTVKLVMPLQVNTPKVPYIGDIIENTALSYYKTRQITFDGKVDNAYFEQYPDKQQYRSEIQLCYDFDANNGCMTHITADQFILEKKEVIQRISVQIDDLSEKEVIKDTEDEQKAKATQKPTFKDKIVQWWNA